MSQSFRLLSLITILMGFVGCSGGAGEPVQVNLDLSDNGANQGGLVLSGPPPQTDDVQRFRLNLWENVAADKRCGQCHGTGGQSPTFARNDNINLAYDQVNPNVDLQAPERSRLVAKVGGGHNCWLDSDQACADILTTWISNWAGESGDNINRIALTAPVLRDPGASRSFPEDAGAFASTIHPLLMNYCAGCHESGAAVPQSPFFAGDDAAAAYQAARSKIELDDPASSRLVIRLGDEFHNCWTECSANALSMQEAVAAFVENIPETEVDPLLITSKAVGLIDGVVASGGGRHDANAIALYQFKTSTGSTAFDTSGVEPALDLTLTGDINWVGGWGLRVGEGGKAQGSTASSAKLHRLMTATGEYSVEAWVVPGNVVQEDARIVSYSGGNAIRNFAIGQTLYNYDFFSRSSATDASGVPALSTPDADEVLQATLQHVVASYDPTTGPRLYVNGNLIDAAGQEPGNLNDWDDTFAFVLGNEVSGDQTFEGVIRFAAVHNRALTLAQIRQNFDAGVGENFFMLFGVSHLVDVPEAFIVFEVSQFDDYSYLFSNPQFLSLDADVMPSNIALRGMRIGINGRETEVGQAYSRLEVSLGADAYLPGSGQLLSPVGTVVGIEKGTDADEFFLTFEELGNNTTIRAEPFVEPMEISVDESENPAIGIRQFDEINASMAAITGVAMSQSQVAQTFSTIRQQLPGGADIEGFLSSQQMAVTQLAIEYCNALVDDPVLRDTLFPAFEFDQRASIAFASTDNYLPPLMDAAIGADIDTGPDPFELRSELDQLITGLLDNGEDTAERTGTIAKASCAAVLGSAAMLIQ